MKWSELYDYFEIKRAKDQPNYDIGNFFERIAFGETFAIELQHIAKGDDGKEKVYTCRQDLLIRIIKIEFDSLSGKTDITVTFKTVGVLPPGFIHGTYEQIFSDGRYGDRNINQAMFKDEEAPKNILNEWKKNKNKKK